MAGEMSVKDVTDLIHNRPAPTGGGDEEDYEMADYGNVDAADEFSPDYAPDEATVAPSEEATEEAPAEGLPINWQVVATEQQRELAELRREREARARADFEKRVKELPPEEQGDFVMKYYQEQERAKAIDDLREKQVQTHPLTTLLGGPFFRQFQMEVDNPEDYTRILDAMEPEFADLLGKLVQEGVKGEMEKFYAETGQQWGVKKLGGAQPKGLTPKNPVRASYENKLKEMKAAPNSADRIAALIRARNGAR
jgi:hypothetical protein